MQVLQISHSESLTYDYSNYAIRLCPMEIRIAELLQARSLEKFPPFASQLYCSPVPLVVVPGAFRQDHHSKHTFLSSPLIHNSSTSVSLQIPTAATSLPVDIMTVVSSVVTPQPLDPFLLEPMRLMILSLRLRKLWYEIYYSTPFG